MKPKKDYQVRTIADDGEEDVTVFSSLREAEEGFDSAIEQTERNDRYAEIELIEVLAQYTHKI